MKFVDPKNDIAFRKIFGTNQKKEILISFLNAVLAFEGDKRIVDLTIQNPYQSPQTEDLKNTILDIKAINQAGEEFIVEMQNKNIGDFTKRSLYYTSKAYVNQLDKSITYSRLQKVYFVGIINFRLFETQNYISKHMIINQENGKQDIKDFEFYFIELQKFEKDIKNLDTILDKWIYFIKNASNLNIIPKELVSEYEIKEAFDIAEEHCWNKEELEIYTRMRMKIMDDINAIDTATKIGLEKGMEIGVEKGKLEGKLEGEKQKAIEIAKKMLAKNSDIGIIVEFTGLSESEIKEIIF